MEIRVLSESDASAWWHLRLEALEREPFAFGKSVEEHRATPVEVIAARFRDTGSHQFTLGAFEGSELVGMMTFVRDSNVKERHKGRVFGVYVSRAHRLRGVARMLLGALLDRVRLDPGVEQVLLSVTSGSGPARRLYESFGFQSYGTEPRAKKVGDSYFDEDYMILVL